MNNKKISRYYSSNLIRSEDGRLFVGWFELSAHNKSEKRFCFEATLLSFSILLKGKRTKIPKQCKCVCFIPTEVRFVMLTCTQIINKLLDMG